MKKSRKNSLILGLLAVVLLIAGCGTRSQNRAQSNHYIWREEPSNALYFYPSLPPSNFVAVYWLGPSSKKGRIALVDLKGKKILDRITLEMDTYPLIWINEKEFLLLKKSPNFSNTRQIKLLCYDFQEKKIKPMEIKLPTLLSGIAPIRAFHWKRDGEYFTILVIKGLKKSFEESIWFCLLSKQGKPIKWLEGYIPQKKWLSGNLFFFPRNSEDIVSLDVTYSPERNYAQAVYHLSKKKKMLFLLGDSIVSNFGVSLFTFRVIALVIDRQGNVSARLLDLSSSTLKVRKLKLPREIMPSPSMGLKSYWFYDYRKGEDSWILLSQSGIWIADKDLVRFKKLISGEKRLGTHILQIDPSSFLFSEQEAIWCLNVKNGEKKLVWSIKELFPTTREDGS